MTHPLYNVLIVGNPHFDRIQTQHFFTNDRIPSGCALNTALVMSKLGVDHLAFIGSLGDDYRARLVESFSNGYDIEYMFLSTEFTAGFDIVCNNGTNLIRKIINKGSKIRIGTIPDEFLQTQMIVLAPSYNEINSEFIHWIADSSDAQILLDPQGILYQENGNGIIQQRRNLEPLDGILESVDILKANHSEASLLTGETDPFLCAELLHEAGAKTNIVTLGREGSILYDGQEFLIIPSYSAHMRDCTVAGEAYTAGFVYEMLNRRNLLECGIFATTTASIMIERTGPTFSVDESVIRQLSSSLISRVKRK